jgi:hypothetical protein
LNIDMIPQKKEERCLLSINEFVDEVEEIVANLNLL